MEAGNLKSFCFAPKNTSPVSINNQDQVLYQMEGTDNYLLEYIEDDLHEVVISTIFLFSLAKCSLNPNMLSSMKYAEYDHLCAKVHHASMKYMKMIICMLRCG